MAGFNEPTTDAEMTDERGPKTDDYNRIDFSMNEQTFISLLLAILANMLIDFSPCKEVSRLESNPPIMSDTNNEFYLDPYQQRHNKNAYRIRRF